MAPVNLFLISILISSHLIPIALSEDSPLLNKICTTTSGNYSGAGSAFATNLESLLDALYKQTSHNQGSGNATLGKGHDQVYGIALCRGDVSPDDCEDCIYDARCKVTRRCIGREAMVWYDYCYLKYSGSDFFGKINHDNYFILVNVADVEKPKQDKFKKAVVGLLIDVSKIASGKATLFAGGEKFHKNGNITIYTMAQCRRDLSNTLCDKCLDYAVKELPIYEAKGGKGFSVGGRVVREDCNVRYETYKFLKNFTSV